MAELVEISVIVDSDGRVLGADLSSGAPPTGDDGVPVTRLIPTDGQSLIRVQVQPSLLELPGPELYKYFSELRLRPERGDRIVLPVIDVEEADGST